MSDPPSRPRSGGRPRTGGSAAAGPSANLPTGLPVDISGGPTIDPTENVLNLVDAANQRQDDLRGSERRYFDAAIAHVKELATLRAEYQEKILALQADFQSRLDAAESARIDSIREVDRLAMVNTATQSRAETATLAATQAAQAETLRAAVAGTATTLQAQVTSSNEAFNKRLTLVEQSIYEGMGKSRVEDPQLAQLTALVRELAQNQARGTGQGAGASSAMVYVVAAVSALIGIGGLLIALFKP